MTNARLLAKLVAFDSTSANSNLPIADFICDYLDLPGVTVRRYPSADATKTNLLIRVGKPSERNAESGLLLSGHMDAVPAREPEWNSDPFTLTETDDAYVGRGACDMKGFLALAINAARERMNTELTAPLMLLLTYDEEPGTLGAQRFVETWNDIFPLPHHVVIGEPTSLRVVRMHKGHLKLRITCRGRSAHSGYPHLGINAIERMGVAIDVVANLRRQLEAERCATSCHFAKTPFVVINQAIVDGGVAANIVPDRCTLTVGVRLLPGMKTANFLPRIESALTDAEGLDDYSLEVVSDSPPLLTDETTEIHRMLCSLVGQNETTSASYATDAGPLQALNLAPVIWGPGNIEVAHRPNESMPKAEFAQAASLLEQLVRTCCTSQQ